MDSECSKHMVRRIEDFLLFKAHKRCSVSFVDRNKRYIIGIVKVGNGLRQTIDVVHFVDRLKFNLLSVAQICDKGNEVKFRTDKCTVTSLKNGDEMLTAWSNKNIFVVDLVSYKPRKMTFLSVQEDIVELWHRRLGHVSCSLLNKLVIKDLVRGFPKLKFARSKVCDACVKEKQTKSSFKLKKEVNTSRPLQLLHIYLCGLIKTASKEGKNYMLVIIDDYSRFTWTFFLRSKEEMFPVF